MVNSLNLASFVADSMSNISVQKSCDDSALPLSIKHSVMAWEYAYYICCELFSHVKESVLDFRIPDCSLPREQASSSETEIMCKQKYQLILMFCSSDSHAVNYFNITLIVECLMNVSSKF